MPTAASAELAEQQRTFQQSRLELVDLGLLLGETRTTGFDLHAELIEERGDGIEVAERAVLR